MKKLVSLFVLVLLCLSLSIPSLACTSFAVYSGERPVYGMNFDYTDEIFTLRLDQPEGYMNVFSVYHTPQPGLDASIPTMNEDGFFTTVQALSPTQPVSYEWQEGDESVPNLAMWSPYVVSKVQDLRAIAQDNPPKQYWGSYHSLYADMQGDGTVLDVYGDALFFTDIEGDYLLMTNFPNVLLKDTPMEQIEEILDGGVDRYLAAQDTIEARKDGFTVEDGFAVLESAVNHSLFNPTRYSVVCDPENRLIYLTLHGDFSHVWRVSMDQRTVETHQGFQTPASIDIGEEGVALNDLWAYAVSDGQ